MNHKTCGKRQIDPDPVAIASLVLSAIGTVATIGFGVTNEVSKTISRRRNRRAKAIALRLVELQSRLLELKNIFESIVDKCGIDISVTKFRYGDAHVYLDDAEFSYINRTIDRLITCIRHTYREVGRVITAMSKSSFHFNEEIIKGLLSLRKKCNEVIWESDTFGQAKDKMSDLFSESVTVVQKSQVFLETMKNIPEQGDGD
jgi:hypothetical protein